MGDVSEMVTEGLLCDKCGQFPGACDSFFQPPGHPVTCTECRGFTVQGESITHLKCGKTSHNKNDVTNRYCGHCHQFLEEQQP